jgi:large subunit ribosomal protein L5
MDSTVKSKPASKPVTARLKAEYYSKIAKELKEELKLKNIHQVPKLEKIVVNVGLGKAKEDKKAMSSAEEIVKKITGQQPIFTVSKQSISSFKLREGQRIGLKVTLRGERMYEFMDRFINIVLPRLRDFHGVSTNSFDGSGNFSVGLSENSVFPELSFEETSAQGLQINFVINAKNKEHSKALLTKFGMPFEKAEKPKEEVRPEPTPQPPAEEETEPDVSEPAAEQAEPNDESEEE